jgi:hypothetical protein
MAFLGPNLCAAQGWGREEGGPQRQDGNMAFKKVAQSRLDFRSSPTDMESLPVVAGKRNVISALTGLPRSSGLTAVVNGLLSYCYPPFRSWESLKYNSARAQWNSQSRQADTKHFAPYRKGGYLLVGSCNVHARGSGVAKPNILNGCQSNA